MNDYEFLNGGEEYEDRPPAPITECMCETCRAVRKVQGRPDPPPPPKLDETTVGNAGMLRGTSKRDLLYAKEEIIARQLEDFMNEFPEVDIRKIKVRPDKEHIGRLVVTIKTKERKNE